LWNSNTPLACINSVCPQIFPALLLICILYGYLD
jgi:hypothetical protein